MNLRRRVAAARPRRTDTPDGPSGKAVGGPYTRPKMVRGTLGDERQVDLDGLYADAKQALSSTANRLRTTTQRFREAYTARYEAWLRLRDHAAPAQETVLVGDGLARAKASLARLELATEDLERSWLFLERGHSGSTVDDAAHAEADRVAPRSLRMHILEAQESERLRLAEDLHDGPAQALANALFHIEIIQRSLRLDPTKTESEIRALQALLERELDAVRDYISQLRPALLQDGDLEAALRDSVSELEGAGITVHTDLSAPDEILDGPRRTVALRIAQEAMRNARKHSGAGNVWLQTKVSDGEHPTWTLVVRDDGRGFDPEETRVRGSRRHFGLRFMRERADLIGARLEIEPDPSSGTLVRLTVEDTERSH
jgi:two-component system sensor histidine kinase DegS